MTYKSMTPKVWGMPNKDGDILDVISPEEHDRLEGGYTVPLYTFNQVVEQRQAIEQAQKRPQNCGTGYCSCIECVMETEQKPLTLWTDAQHRRAYRNSPELHKDVKSFAEFKRIAKKIAAMYGIKE